MWMVKNMHLVAILLWRKSILSPSLHLPRRRLEFTKQIDLQITLLLQEVVRVMAKDGVVEVIEEDLIFPCPESPMNRTPHASPALFGRSSRSYSRSTVSNSHSHSSEGDTFEDFYDELFESGSRSRSIDTLRQHDQVRLHLHLYPPSPSSTHIFSYSFSPPYHFFVISPPPRPTWLRLASSIEKKKKQGKFYLISYSYLPLSTYHFSEIIRNWSKHSTKCSVPDSSTPKSSPSSPSTSKPHSKKSKLSHTSVFSSPRPVGSRT